MTLTGLVAVAILSVSQTSLDHRNAFCGNLENVSHPVNRCAAEQSQGVSLSEWFTGRSSSYQFHFIDLLELLSRSGSNET